MKSSGTGRFRTTQWGAILLSAESEAPGSEEALAELCRRYWYPLYSFVRRVGYGPDDAQDLIQGFFLHLLTHKVLRQVGPQKGKFRSFLLASLQNYLSNEHDRGRCEKRGGKAEFVSLDSLQAIESYELESPDSLPAGVVFDTRWAMTLLDTAMTRLRDKYTSEGKILILERLKLFLDPLNNSESLPSYQQVALELGLSADSVGVLIHRLRKQYSMFLRQEVARTVRPQDVDREIRALCDAFIAAQGLLDP